MTLTESNTVEQMVLDALSHRSGGSGGALVLREDPAGWGRHSGTGVPMRGRCPQRGLTSPPVTSEKRRHRQDACATMQGVMA